MFGLNKRIFIKCVAVCALSFNTSGFFTFGFFSKKHPLYINMATVNTSGSTNCTVNKPTGLKAGDLMIGLIYEGDSSAIITPPSGFSTQHSEYVVDSTIAYRSRLYYKVASAGDEAASNFTFTKTTNFLDCGIMLAAYRNVDQTTPIQTSTLNNPDTTGTTATYNAVTTTKKYSLLLAIGELAAASNPGTITGFTSNWNSSVFGSRWSSKLQIITGSSGALTSTHGSTKWVGSLLVLNPRLF